MDSKAKSKFRTAFEVFTFVIAAATAGFYISDTMTGTPVFAQALKVVGFCPAPVATVVGPTGATGETGSVGATGPAGACQAPMNLMALANNLVPTKDNTFTLGTSALRWKSIHLGPGTIYMQDRVSGEAREVAIANGTLKINGSNLLEVGNLKFIDNSLESSEPGTDITIGILTSVGDVAFNRDIKLNQGKVIKFPDGTVFSTAPTNGKDGAPGVTGPAGATGSAGAQGIQGVQGVQGVQGPAGNSFTLKGSYASMAAFNAGAGATPGAMGDAWLIAGDGSLMVYGSTGWFDAGDLMGPQGVQGVQGVQGPPGPQGQKGDPGAPGAIGDVQTFDSVWSGTGLLPSGRIGNGSYIKNGRFVTFQIQISTTGVTNFGSGQYSLTLPFAPANDYVFRDAGIHDLSTGEHFSFSADAEPGTTTMSLWYTGGSGKDLIFDHNSPISLQAGDYFYVSGTYISAS